MSTNEWPKIYQGSMGQEGRAIDITVTMSSGSSGTWEYLGRAPQPISISRSGFIVTLKNAEMELSGEEIDQHIKGIVWRSGREDGLFGLIPEKLVVGKYIVFTSKSNTIGSGAFGRVFKGRRVDGPRFSPGDTPRYVIKYVKLKTERDAKQVQREVDVLSRIRHQNILPLEDFDVTSSFVIFVLPYMQHGNLSDVLRSKVKRSLQISEAFPTSSQFLHGIEFLHQCEITHRDLKPQNILVPHYVEDIENSNFELFVKIADFGHSRIGDKQPEEAGDKQFAVYGTPAYMAPEICCKMVNVGHALDYWSLGVLIYFLFNVERQLPVPHLWQQDRKTPIYASYLTREQLSSDIDRNVPEGPFRHIVSRLLVSLSAEEWQLVRILTSDYDERKKVFEDSANKRMTAKDARQVLEQEFGETMQNSEDRACAHAFEQEVQDRELRAESVRRQSTRDEKLARDLQDLEDRNFANALQQRRQQSDRSRSRSPGRGIAYAARVGMNHLLSPK